MSRLIRFLLSVAILVCGLVSAGAVSAGDVAIGDVAIGDVIRQQQITFEQNQSSVAITGKVKGYDSVDYQLDAATGQTLVVHFKPDNLSSYFNILPPGSSDEALFIGSSSGNDYEGVLPASGRYTLRVYLMRNAARRNETANYSLSVNLTGNSKPTTENPANQSQAPFDKTLELHGIRFHVSCANQGSVNTVTITPEGLAIDNTPVVREIDGTVTGADVADINIDRSPEIYVYATSAGSGSYGSLLALSANNKKSLSDIYLPPLVDDKKNSQGYRGHDEFAWVESVIVQRFPLYRDGDTNANPTGGMRQLQYKLYPGESGWQLKVDRVVEY